MVHPNQEMEDLEVEVSASDVLLPEMFTGLENGPCGFSEKKPGSRNMFLSMAKLAKFFFSSHPLSKSLLLNFYVNTFSNGLKALG